jgi:spore germination cell wall hydrolase CwlJ-like protein
MKRVLPFLLIPTLSIAQPEIPSETAMDKHCLALNIYHEARGEINDSLGNYSGSMENWLVVAMITRNRLDNSYYPDSWCRVVYDPFQYEWTRDHLPDEPDMTKKAEKEAWEEIEVFVEGFMANHRYIKDPTEGSLDYAGCHVDNYWTRAYNLYKEFGAHCVYHR